jgi:hypothetical protein
MKIRCYSQRAVARIADQHRLGFTVGTVGARGFDEWHEQAVVEAAAAHQGRHSTLVRRHGSSIATSMEKPAGANEDGRGGDRAPDATLKPLNSGEDEGSVRSNSA